jgi:hypothetical protein
MLGIKVKVNVPRAIREGIAASGEGIVRLTQEQLDSLSVEERALLANRATWTWEVVRLNGEGLLASIREEKADEAAKKARAHETHAKILATYSTPEAYCAANFPMYYEDLFMESAATEEVEAFRRAVRALREARETEQKAREAERTRARRAEQERLEEAWPRFCEKYLAGEAPAELYTCSTAQLESMRERHKANFLPYGAKEVVDAVRDGLLQPIADFARYMPLKKSDVCTCRGNEVSFGVESLEELSEEEYRLFKQIEKAMTSQVGLLKELVDEEHLEFEVLPQLHVGEASCCDEKRTSKSIYVSLTIGERTLSRQVDFN